MRPFVTKFNSITWDLPAGPWHTYAVDFGTPESFQVSAAIDIQAGFRRCRERRRRRLVIHRLYLDVMAKRMLIQEKQQARANLKKDHCTMCIFGAARFVLLLRPQRDTVLDLYEAVADVYKKPGFHLLVGGKRMKQSNRKLYRVGCHAGGIFLVRICH